MTKNNRRVTVLLSSILCIAALLSGCAAGSSSPGSSPSVSGNELQTAAPTAAGTSGTATAEVVPRFRAAR